MKNLQSSCSYVMANDGSGQSGREGVRKYRVKQPDHEIALCIDLVFLMGLIASSCTDTIYF